MLRKRQGEISMDLSEATDGAESRENGGGGSRDKVAVKNILMMTIAPGAL